MAPDHEDGGDLDAGGDDAAYKAALESWFDQAVELRAEYTTVDGLKAAMEAEEACTCFPVWVRGGLPRVSPKAARDDFFRPMPRRRIPQ